MVEEYNKRSKAQDLPPDVIYAVQGDLMETNQGTEIEGEKLYGFDAAIISMALHHIEKPDKVVAEMVQRLKTKGVVVVIDFDPAGNRLDKGSHSHGGSHSHSSGQEHHNGGGDGAINNSKVTIAHNGFSQDYVEEILRNAGCAEVRHELFKESTRFGPQGVEKRMFIARGEKRS